MRGTKRQWSSWNVLRVWTLAPPYTFQVFVSFSVLAAAKNGSKFGWERKARFPDLKDFTFSNFFRSFRSFRSFGANHREAADIPLVDSAMSRKYGLSPAAFF